MREESTKQSGMLLTAISAIIYGITPIFARISYDGGSNGIMVTLLRNLIPIPVLFLIVRFNNVEFIVSKEDRRKLLYLAILGCSTTATLYSSYSYIPVGTATVLHFSYPTLVMIGSVVFMKEPLNRVKVIALIISTLGTTVFFEGGLNHVYGIFISLLSGVLFALYVLYVEQSQMKSMHPMLYSFYLCCYSSVLMMGYSLFTGDFTIHMTTAAWWNSIIVALSTSIFATTFLQMGIKRIGPSMASILSMLEPITGVLCGILILHESFSVITIVGCACIFAAILILQKA